MLGSARSGSVRLGSISATLGLARLCWAWLELAGNGTTVWVLLGWFGLGWAGLDRKDAWVGHSYRQLGSAILGAARLSQAELVSTGLSWARLLSLNYLAKLGLPWQGSTGPGWAGSTGLGTICSARLDWDRQGWVCVDWTRLCWLISVEIN